MTCKHTAKELAVIAKRENPTVRYGYHDSLDHGAAVAAFQDGRWIPVAFSGIDGRWYSMEVEVLANGKPMSPREFVEVDVNGCEA